MVDKIRVSAIQRLCLHDGPGVRTTLFLKGCYLACPWCCNPETIHYNKDLYFIKDSSLCGDSEICKLCELKGGTADKGNCPFGVFERTYIDYSDKELYEKLITDKSLFDRDGGITLSGGEPLMQANQLLPLLRKLKESKINITMESSLYAPSENFDLVKQYVDFWIVDVKFQFGFISYLDENLYLNDFESNLLWLQNNVSSRLKIRMVISHQGLKQKDDIVQRFKRYQINEVELLPCHQLAENKYIKLGKNSSIYSAPQQVELKAFANLLNKNSISANVLFM